MKPRSSIEKLKNETSCTKQEQERERGKHSLSSQINLHFFLIKFLRGFDQPRPA